MLFYPWCDKQLELIKANVVEIYEKNLKEINTNKAKYVYGFNSKGTIDEELGRGIEELDNKDNAEKKKNYSGGCTNIRK